MSVPDEAEERFSGSRIQYGCIFVTLVFHATYSLYVSMDVACG